MNPRFEIVHTDAGWHVRLIGANGEKVFTSEVYTRREDAEHAIIFILDTVRDDAWTQTLADERTVQG